MQFNAMTLILDRFVDRFGVGIVDSIDNRHVKSD